MKTLSNDDKKDLLDEMKKTYDKWKADVNAGRIDYDADTELAFKKEIEKLTCECNEKQLNVFAQNGTLVGTLAYIADDDIFIFKYDISFDGYAFGEINILEGKRLFESDSMFGLFSIDESYGRNILIEKYDLDNPDSNETQWYILKNFVNQDNPNKGFYHEEIQC